MRGLRNRCRPGIGAALVSSLEPLPGFQDPAFARVPPGIKIATTAFLRLDAVHQGLVTGHVTGKLELVTPGEGTFITVDKQQVPLEFNLSSALAYTLEGSRVYDIELKGLFSGSLVLAREPARFRDNVFLMAPHRIGRIPIVLVHGTASSPGRWAELMNEVLNDRELWGKYQFWLYTYNTGNPILYSAGILMEGLKNTVKELDPEEKDPAMKKMVVIGHSQGGLLTKLTAVDSGVKFWDNITQTPLDALDVSPETKELLTRSLYYKPLPFVKRVVFVATPHGGSFVAGGWIGRLTGKLISLPKTLLNPLEEIISRDPKIAAKFSIRDIPKSTDNMDPKNRFIKTISSLPIAPGVYAHSIIPVKNPNAPKEKWNDGVVEYSSAHIDGVTSELVVHSGHSTQDHPETIEEIRRILIENLQEP